MLIGVISDTHGLLRPEAVAALSGVERIIHAGDIGKPEVITALEALAPAASASSSRSRWRCSRQKGGGSQRNWCSWNLS